MPKFARFRRPRAKLSGDSGTCRVLRNENPRKCRRANGEGFFVVCSTKGQVKASLTSVDGADECKSLTLIDVWVRHISHDERSVPGKGLGAMGREGT